MDIAILRTMINRNQEVHRYLLAGGEVTLAIETEIVFKRAFVVACGTWCERRLMTVVQEWAARHGDIRLTEFIRIRALERRYHDMFAWDASNANRFFGCFGDSFKQACAERFSDDAHLRKAMHGFMDLGRLRNTVAHEFATASVDRTLNELEGLLDDAEAFLASVALVLNEDAQRHDA